jgi:hypothetical protein
VSPIPSHRPKNSIQCVLVFFKSDLDVAYVTSLLHEPFSSRFLSLPRYFSPPEICLHSLAPLAPQVHSVLLSMASSLAPASWAPRLQPGGGGEPFQPRATSGHGATPRRVRGPGQWGGGNGRRGQGGGGGRGEEGRVEEAGTWQAGVEADLVRIEEDLEHHHPQRPHRHLWYAHLIWSHPSLCMLISILFD